MHRKRVSRDDEARCPADEPPKRARKNLPRPRDTGDAANSPKIGVDLPIECETRRKRQMASSAPGKRKTRVKTSRIALTKIARRDVGGNLLDSIGAGHYCMYHPSKVLTANSNLMVMRLSGHILTLANANLRCVGQVLYANYWNTPTAFTSAERTGELKSSEVPFGRYPRTACGYTPEIRFIKTEVENVARCEFTHASVGVLPTRESFIPWTNERTDVHAPGAKSKMCLLMFGGDRRFLVRSRSAPYHYSSVEMAAGSMVELTAATLRHYQYSVIGIDSESIVASWYIMFHCLK